MGKGDDQAKQQAKRLEEQRKAAEREAAKLRADNKKKADANYRRRLGRSMLVTTSELGVSDELG